jgi:hypothetical protein
MGPLIVKHWKLFGLAGLAGVAATGVVIVRAERRRQAFTPDEVRARLHQRYEAADPGATIAAAAAVTTAAPAPNGRLRFWQRLRRKRRTPSRERLLGP